MSNDGQNIQNSNDDATAENNQPVAGGSDETANNPGYQDQSSDQNESEKARTGAEKDPKDWVTGSEDATPAQKSYMSTMAVEAGEAVPEELSKAEASEKIQELQEKTGRDTNSERP